MAIIFPDNTVLINFAYCDAMDLLERIVAGRGSWTASVASECRDKAVALELPSMNVAHRIFGDPLWPDPAEHILQTRIHQDHFRNPGDGPRKHLGESETLAIIENRQVDHAVFVTDDAGVAARARTCGIRVRCITTWDLIRFGVRAKYMTEDVALQMRERLMHRNRVHLAHVREQGEFLAWLREQ